MKIAILGNMNNVGFVLLRYLRVLGADADLLLYKSDGIRHSSHFIFESDSWEPEKWQPYVHQLPIANSYGSALSNFLFIKIILLLAYTVRKFLGSQNAHLTKPATKKEVRDFKNILSKYDCFIGSGSTPAIFEANNLKLDIFFPYSMGIENFNEKFFFKLTKSKNIIVRLIASKMRNLQRLGILNSKVSINPDISWTKRAYEELGIKPVYVYPPHVFVEKPAPEDYSKNLKDALKKIENFDYTLISHSRHQWIKPSSLSENEFLPINKNSDWLIRGFASYLEVSKKDALLVLFEYGIDYKNSKLLIQDLGIENNIYWLPLMQRKEIMEIIKVCDVGVGEFYSDNVFMGATGYEILTQAKPLIQGPLDSKEFTEITKIPRPPGFFASSSDEIRDAILSLEDECCRADLGEQGLKWIQDYSSFSNAKKLIQLLEN